MWMPAVTCVVEPYPIMPTSAASPVMSDMPRPTMKGSANAVLQTTLAPNRETWRTNRKDFVMTVPFAAAV
jgi:hypothetical protein